MSQLLKPKNVAALGWYYLVLFVSRRFAEALTCCRVVANCRDTKSLSLAQLCPVFSEVLSLPIMMIRKDPGMEPRKQPRLPFRLYLKGIGTIFLSYF